MRTAMVRRAQRLMLGVVVFGLAVLALFWWQDAQAGLAPSWFRQLTGSPLPLDGRRIGIVAGHSGNDTGTVCADGLTELSVNESVARLVVAALRRQGATVDLLKEFDPRLAGFTSDAFISIHTDSCQAPADFSGYKVAGQDGGSSTSARLVTCLWDSYAEATGLKPHYNTITTDMRDYHAFRVIAPHTPAAIIELGFLNNDRALLTTHPERAAAGITAGLVCFLTTK